MVKFSNGSYKLTLDISYSNDQIIHRSFKVNLYEISKLYLTKIRSKYLLKYEN